MPQFSSFFLNPKSLNAGIEHSALNKYDTAQQLIGPAAWFTEQVHPYALFAPELNGVQLLLSALCLIRSLYTYANVVFSRQMVSVVLQEWQEQNMAGQPATHL